jgi:hypothetical protein
VGGTLLRTADICILQRKIDSRPAALDINFSDLADLLRAAVRRRSAPLRLACGAPTTMELNRNQYFFIGLVVLLIGLQLRAVSSYTLTHEATRFLAERSEGAAADKTMLAVSSDMGARPQKVIHPPEWLGWCLMSVGGVLILHSLAMKKPGA